MYTFDSRIRYSETGEDGRITLSAIIDYLQDCTNFHSEDMGMDIAFHMEKQLMWVLNSWQIVIEQYPKMGEKITIGTQAYGYDKMTGYRNFLITDSQGDTIVKANSVWVLMDLKKMRPMMIPDFMIETYELGEPIEMEYAPRKIKIPGEGTPGKSFLVREHHLDTTHHVNNRQYVQMAMLSLEEKITVAEVRVEYKRQAVLGDSITPVMWKESEKEIYVSLNDEKMKPYAVVQFFAL